MKKKNLFIIGLALMLLFSCIIPDNTPEKKEPEIKWPLDGVVIKEMAKPNVDAIPGTYEKSIGFSFETELVSFMEDGTLVSIPFSNLLSYASFPRKQGTWSYDKEANTIRITIGDDTIESRVLTLTNNNTKIGFGYIDKNNNQVKFHKRSDKYIDTSIYRSKTFGGIYATQNNFEEVYGWEFRKDGTAYYHQTDRKSFKHTYKTNPDKALIRITDAMGLSEDYNYCLLDGYLYLNGIPYQKIR